jgi:hypothetical protein
MNVTRFAPSISSFENAGLNNRGTKTVKMANSASLYIGSFFDPRTGTNGAQSFAANQKARGIVTNIYTQSAGNYISVFDAPALRAGTTLVNATNKLPGKYTTSSDNASLAEGAFDYVEYIEILPGDRVRAYLSTGTAGNLATRGTTAASAVLNNFIEPDPNYPYMLLESGANATATGLNFQIVGFPTGLPNMVLVSLINADGSVS